jgi:leucyl-tRNA synthetase
MPAVLGTPAPTNLDPAAEKVHRLAHQTIHAVGLDLERFHFNKAVARIRELTNAVDTLEPGQAGAEWAMREGLETVVQLIGPMMPHLAEEMWRELGHDALLAETPWPKADPALLVEDEVTMAVQVNGKLRGTLFVAKDSPRDEVEKAALALPNVERLLDSRPPRKVIVVPNRIVNVVL